MCSLTTSTQTIRNVERYGDAYTEIPFWFQAFFRYGTLALISIMNMLRHYGIDIDF